MFAPQKIKPEEIKDYSRYLKFIKLDEYGDTSTSFGRFKERLRFWLDQPNGFFEHHGWWLLHNVVAHPVLGLVPCQKTVEFHDWASEKLNQHEPYWRKPKVALKSPLPVINNRLAWVKHNVVSHIAIGLVPCARTFWYHDKTALEQNVKGWV